MADSPSNVLQFREAPPIPSQGSIGGCGSRGWPKRHRWGPWQDMRVKATGALYRERMCQRCGLWSDREWRNG